MNKAELLFNAYRNRSEIIPFPLAESEAKEVGK
ncbi:MAG: 2-keto-4-pentenoate hydratase, partial [Metallosphaera sp.]